jgi:SAM-dependent methyltransferase
MPAPRNAVPEGAGALELERVEACPLCGSGSTKTWRSNCRDWQQPEATDRFDYRHCTRCSAYFLSPRPLESELGRIYFEGYGPYRADSVHGPAPRGAGPLTRAAGLGLSALGLALGAPGRKRLAARLDQTYTPETLGEVLLDYGCGSAASLDEARERGFATIGADFAAPVIDEVRARGHQAYQVGPELERGVPEATVGCVRMNHVVEHLYRPREALAEVRAKLRPGGRLHLSTPNPASLGSRLFGRRWHALDCPRHVVLYRPSVLRELLHGLGFREISIVHEVGPKDLTRSWGIVLYERGRVPHEQIDALKDDRVRSGLFLPAASIAAFLGAADRYHVFARA